MAELTEKLEEMESPLPLQKPAVPDGAFATVFDVPLFAQLDDSQRACFSTGTEIRVKAGETLISDGDPADVFYVMLEGELRVTEVLRRTGDLSCGSDSRGVFFRD